MHLLPHSASAEAFIRFKHLWWLKAIGTSLFMVVFFRFYFSIMHAPASVVSLQTLTTLDLLIPFQAQWFYLYASLWVYTSIAPALMPSFLKLLEFGIFISLLCAIGLMIFNYFPTAVPYDTSQLANADLLKLLHDIDQTGNAFPSLHVACAIFCGLSLNKTLKDIQTPNFMRYINLLWCLGIVFSTLAIKQHSLLDVGGGIFLALTIFGFYKHWRLLSYQL
jgi:membrane-associated phospholipid phosphatase